MPAIQPAASDGGTPLRVAFWTHAVLIGLAVNAVATFGSMAAIVMDGVVVQDEVIIGAGSLVPPGKVLESGFLYKGRPATKSRALTEGEFRIDVLQRRNDIRRSQII